MYFKRRSFRSGIVAKVYTVEKADFPSFTIFFPFAEFLRLKYMQRVKELIRQMNSGPYALGTDGSNDEVGTDGSNDESGLKKLNPVLIRCLMITKGKSLFSS